MLFWGLRRLCPSISSCHTKDIHASSDKGSRNCSFPYKKTFIFILILSLIFCLLVFYTNPLHSSYSLSTGSPAPVKSNAWQTRVADQSYHSINLSQPDLSYLPVDEDRNEVYYTAPKFNRPPRLKVPGTQRRLPEALIIGVRKCGTRALLEMLNLHPNIRKRDAEVHFFDDDERFSKGFDWYRKRMPYSFDNQITIEKTPSYFVSREAPSRILAMDPDVKLLLIVRDPAMRVLSDYAQILESKKSKGNHYKPFHKLVFLPNGEINDSYNAIQISQYVVHILRWLRVFARHQLHIVDGDRLIRNPYPEIRKVEKFLELPSKIQPSNFYFNRTKGFYCMRNETHQKCLADSKGRRHPYVDPGIMEALRHYFAPFNEQFYQIVGQNFSWPSS